jgi:hypothetical protein
LQVYRLALEIFFMLLPLILFSAVLIILLIAYFRHAARRHVASLFDTMVRKQIAAGLDLGQAMREGVKRLCRRPPFNRIDEGELSFFLDVLQDLQFPVEVGAEILQDCEARRSVSDLKNQRKVLELAYGIDLKISLRRLVQNARMLHKKLTQRYPNLTVALLASLSVREGWTFVEEQPDALLFSYRERDVLIPKSGTGKNAARLILFEEIAHRALLARPGDNYETRNSVRLDLIGGFDKFFDETFQKASEHR